MKITTSERVSNTHDIEISFPVFRKYDSGGDGYEAKTWQRWDADGTLWDLCYSYSYRTRVAGWEIERSNVRTPDIMESLDFVLGRGEYECTPEQFAQALTDARAFVAAI